MKERISTAELISALVGAGLQGAMLREEQVAGQQAVIGGTYQLDEHELDLRVWIPLDFPLSLPTVIVVNHESLGFVPHLTAIGSICYHEGEGSVQSLWRPEQVAAEALQLALRVLKASLAQRDGVGVVEEMEWWWSRQRGCWTAWRSVFTAGELVKRIQRAGDLVFEKGSAVGTKNLPIMPGLYLPLAPSLFERRLDPRHLLEVGRLRGLLRHHLDEDNRKLLRARLRSGPAPRFLVLGVPRPSGDRALIGVHFEGALDPHPLCEDTMNADARIVPVLIDRLDRKRLLERGGANPDLAQKRVVVVGVGAVGGYVSEAIARTGIGELLLVDPDWLRPENMYRHTLGCPRLSQILPILALADAPAPVPKAETLATHLRSSLLHLGVGSITASIQTALELPALALSATDLMIVAIGNPTVSRGLNLELLARGGPRAVYTWLEPLGVGGHALLTAASGQPGCYECLFADDEGTEVLAPRTDFVAPNQDVLSRLGGCGASFTPFSDLDARRTAELAVRLAMEALIGSEQGPKLRSWRGSREAAEARGLKFTARYELRQDQLDAEPTGFVHSRCRICGS
jgi:hypothetical protein